MKKKKKNLKERKIVSAKNKLLPLIGVGVVIVVSLLIIFTRAPKEREINGDICFTRECNPDYWSELPSMPDDFEARKSQYQYNIIPDDPNIFTEVYWKQPEWVTRSGQEMEKFYNMLRVVEGGREPIWCVGIYDAQKVFRIDKEELDRESIEVDPIIQVMIDKGLMKIESDGLIIRSRF